QSYVGLLRRTYSLDRTNFFLLLSALHVILPAKDPSRDWRHVCGLGGAAAALVIAVWGLRARARNSSWADSPQPERKRLRPFGEGAGGDAGGFLFNKSLSKFGVRISHRK